MSLKASNQHFGLVYPISGNINFQVFWVFLGRLIQEGLYAATAKGCGDRVEWCIAKINALFYKVHYTQTGYLGEYAAKQSQKHLILFKGTIKFRAIRGILAFQAKGGVCKENDSPADNCSLTFLFFYFFVSVLMETRLNHLYFNILFFYKRNFCVGG
ncbi:MAG: hypothetical protein Q7T85_05535, partial [Nitrosomonas sp.]|nr:hypothetical protein [Nitrosomonas sp.]